MKKLWAIVLAAALCACLCACEGYVSILPGSTEAPAETAEASGPQPAQEETQADTAASETFEETSFYSFMGWDEFGENYYSDTPVALSCAVAGGYASPVFDRTSIVAACDALRGVTVTGRAESAAAGDETTYTFTMSDGDTYTVTFQGSVLTTGAGSYTFTGGEELFALTFPGYDSGYDLFDLYYDDAVRAFADSFVENVPVSVGRRTNGGAAITTEDADAVQQVFALLYGAVVNRVEASPDQNIDLTQTTDYIFTMSDGTSYTFSFADSCLAVTVSDVYGTVYYWLDGLDTLSSVSILPSSSAGSFEGGAVASLRDDIQAAADIANGVRDDLSIAGVYVGYSIGGEDGYVTMDGDEAYEFIRAVTSVTAYSDTVTDPSGDTLTISVTLSDGSGPILYFTGDSIQQMAGTSYACSSDDMSALRSTVLELAADGDSAETVEGTTD